MQKSKMGIKVFSFNSFKEGREEPSNVSNPSKYLCQVQPICPPKEAKCQIVCFLQLQRKDFSFSLIVCYYNIEFLANTL